MPRLIKCAVFAGALALAGCGDTPPPGVAATKAKLATVNGVTWRNLCKKVTIDFTDDAGAPARYGLADPIPVTVSGAAGYATNQCTGSPLTSVFPGPDATSAIFFVKAVAAGTVKVSIAYGAISADVSLTAQNPTANLVIGQPDFTTGGANASGLSGASMNFPADVELCEGRVMVADQKNNRILVWNTAPTVNGQVANLVIGQATFAANGPLTTAAGLSAPSSAVCVNSKLLIADFANSRMMGYNVFPAGSGVAADFVWGQPNFTTGGANPASSTADEMATVSVSGSKLVATNPISHRMLIWNNAPTAGGVAADLVIGQSSFTATGAAAPPTAASLNTPYFGRIRGTNLLVADSVNNRVLIYNLAGLANGASAALVVGQSDFVSTASGTTASMLNSPLSVDSDGDHLIVADTGNSRILIWNGMPTFNGQPADVVVGAATFVAGSGGVSAITGVYSSVTVNGPDLWVSDYNSRVLRFGAP